MPSPTPIRRRHHRDQQLHSTTKMQSSATDASAMKRANNNAAAAANISTATALAAMLYIVSGVSQPLLMTVAGQTGVADPRAQLYMVFYYIGPASVGLTLRRRGAQSLNQDDDSDEKYWPSFQTICRAASIAVLDIVAQSMNYTGNTLSGPTVFAIIYSSVTIWAAVYSRILLGRDLNWIQWVGVASVFLGLALTALHSVNIGQSVFVGAVLVVVGSSLHAMTYVISEKLMTVGEEKISVRANCAVQGIVACSALFVWQLLYTLPRFHELISLPMAQAGSSWVDVAIVLSAIGLANLVHSTTFFHTLKNFPGGSVSAGVMKGLQAVLVFVFTSIVFCGAPGTGEEMCFSSLKFLSLIVVVGGVLLYGWATDTRHRQDGQDDGILSSIRFADRKGGYNRLPDVESQLEIGC